MRRTKKDCQICATPPAFPLTGATFTRRGFLRIGGLGLTASFFADALSPSLLQAAGSVSPRLHNTAKNCILIFLEGAPSHVDLWDFKEGPWTPATLQPTSYGAVRWPNGWLGKTAAHLDKLAIVRSAESWVAVHALGQLWAQIGRNPAGALGNVAPHIGSVVSIESQARRRVSDVLPSFISLETPRATSGYFSSTYGPLTLRLRGSAGVSALNHPEGDARFTRRLELLNKLDPDREGVLGKQATDFGDFYPAAQRLTESPEIGALFELQKADRDRYGATQFGDSLLLARQILAADRGTRFVQTTYFGWDHHSDFYAQHAVTSERFDSGFSALLADLSATAGSVEGKTLLDETLIVVYSEFGRTVGPLNRQQGRDHFPRMSVVFAGGGVRGGRIIGKTDNLGDKVTEYGWRGERDVRPEDVAATIYSALGIDYTIIRYDDPLGRGFEYVPFAREGQYEPVSELFA
jgi:hypothetical protein